MKEYCVRLEKGADLKKSIEEYCLKNDIGSAVIISSVGCLYHLNIRLAKAIDKLCINDNFEILSLNGTVAKGAAHLHISVSNDEGKCLGGHLLDGCLIDTTCELILLELDRYEAKREYDEKTGYDEIVFKEKEC